MAIFIGFIASMLFITFTLFMNAEDIYFEEIQELRFSKIQKVCSKKQVRQRKVYVPKRSVDLAQNVLEHFLKKNPIIFTQNDFSLVSNQQSKEKPNQKKKILNKIVAILNNIREDAILSITAYTDKVGSAKGNLTLSQKRADTLKAYFLKRTSLVLIVAIGYGEALPATSRRIEINLKKVY